MKRRPRLAATSSASGERSAVNAVNASSRKTSSIFVPALAIPESHRQLTALPCATPVVLPTQLFLFQYS